MIAAAAFAFAACEAEPEGPAAGTKLETPAPEVKEADMGETFFTVSWAAVAGADTYTVNMKGKNYTTAETSYKFENLNKGDYTVRVKATGEGYKDSDFGSVTVSLTGATSVTWFTQTATARAEEVAIDFTWKGEGVKSILYGIFSSESASAADDATIIANLSGLGEDEASILAEVNGAGFEASYDQGLYGSTKYTLFAYVVNEDGIEFLARTEVTTPEAKPAEEAKAWLGNWTAYTEKVAAYDQDKKDFVVSDKRTDFTFSIAMEEGTTNNVLVDNLSFMGQGIPAFGTVTLAEDEAGNVYNCLYIWSYQNLGDVGNGYYAFWLTYCSLADGKHTFVTGEFPAWMLIMDSTGAITCEMYEGELQDGSVFTAQATELFAMNPETGAIGFMGLDEEGTPNATLKYGPMKEITKAAATTEALSAKKAALNFSFNNFATSVVAM